MLIRVVKRIFFSHLQLKGSRFSGKTAYGMTYFKLQQNCSKTNILKLDISPLPKVAPYYITEDSLPKPKHYHNF